MGKEIQSIRFVFFTSQDLICIVQILKLGFAYCSLHLAHSITYLWMALPCYPSQVVNDAPELGCLGSFCILVGCSLILAISRNSDVFDRILTSNYNTHVWQLFYVFSTTSELCFFKLLDEQLVQYFLDRLLVSGLHCPT